MNREGVVVEHSKKFGRKITHKLTHPEMCVGFDETSGNTSQKKDRKVGNEKFLCAVGSSPAQSINTSNNRYTQITLTLLDGRPLMNVVIFAAKELREYEATGIDIFADEVGERTDKDYIRNNTGAGKLFPGGPVCEIDGKKFQH